MNDFLRSYWEKAISYSEFKALSEKLLAEGKTTGKNQSLEYVEYTKLTLQRIKKWDKILVLNETTISSLKNISGNYQWLVIVEAWCGDVGQSLPALKAMADAAHIELRVVMRDDNPELMNEFLTNESMAIPKLIVLDSKKFDALGSWGPRPKEAQKILMEGKNLKNLSSAQVYQNLHLWFAKNKQQDIQMELLEVMRNIASKQKSTSHV